MLLFGSISFLLAQFIFFLCSLLSLFLLIIAFMISYVNILLVSCALLRNSFHVPYFVGTSRQTGCHLRSQKSIVACESERKTYCIERALNLRSGIRGEIELFFIYFVRCLYWQNSSWSVSFPTIRSWIRMKVPLNSIHLRVPSVYSSVDAMRLLLSIIPC